MLLSPSLGAKIIEEVKTLIDEDLIVVNTAGIIIASTDKSRIGDFHAGGKMVSASHQYMEIHPQDTSRLQGVRAGINLPILFQGEVIGVIGITGNPEKVSRFGLIVKKMTELLIQENYFFQQTEWENRALESFVYDWVQGAGLSNELIQKAGLLGVNLEIPRRCAVIKINKHGTQLSAESAEYVHDWLKACITGLIIPWGNDNFIILHEAHAQSKAQCEYIYSRLAGHLEEKFQIKFTAGVGEVFPADEVRESFKQAQQASSIAVNGRALFFEELDIEICLQDIQESTRQRFIRKTIGPLLAEEELLTTLRAFLRHNQNIKETAADLHVHINTVHYRLAKIDELTGHHIKEISSLLAYYMALTFLDEDTIK